MHSEQIRYHDRYLNQTCVEKVYGEPFLRWTYETLGGKVALAALVKRALFSKWYGWRMDRAKSRNKILPFIQEYELEAEEFVKSHDEFANFNQFFYRQLKTSARPIAADTSAVVFPADGRHLCVPDLSRSDGLFVKGKSFSLSSLLDDEVLTRRYASGSLLLSRLCPVDYHRFHFPAAGRPGTTRFVNGPLYSVNPIALRQNIEILATNKRTITLLKTETLGTVLLLEIGATCVGSICQTYETERDVSKGDEKGYFRFGGSSTITIFEPGKVKFDADLVNHSGNQVELYARMGDQMGVTV